MSETCTCVSTSEVTISSISRASIRSAACAAPSRGRRRHSSGGRRPLTCTVGKSTKNPPSSPTRFRTFAVFGWVDMAVTRTWLAVRPPRRQRPNRHRQPDAEVTARRRSPGRRKSFEAGATGAPELRSRAPHGRRARRLRRRETGTLGAGRAKTPVEGVASGRRRNSRRLLDQPRPDAYGGRRWRRAREMSAGTNRNPSTVLAPASRAAVRRGKVAGHAFLDAYGEASPGLPAHSSSSARPADRIVASHRGEDGESRVPRSTFAPPRSTRVSLRSPAQAPRRGIRESLPARPIVTALRSDQCLST